MNLERFKQMLNIYGGHPHRWPPDERQAAQKLLEISIIAQQWQQDAIALDQLLDHAVEIMPSAGLKSRILASAHAIVHETDIWQWLAQWLWGTTLLQHFWRPALIVGLPIFLGIGLGTSVSYQQTQLNESTITTQSEFTNLLYPEQQNITEWAEWL